MRRPAASAALLATSALLLAAAPAAALEVRADDGDSGRTVALERGDLLRVSLAENPSTGFGWRFSRRPARRVLRLRSDSYIAPEQTTPPTFGAGGTREYLWRATGEGKTRLTLRLQPPGGGDATETFRLRIVVG